MSAIHAVPRDRVRKLMVFSDLHATQITLSTAEALMVWNFLCNTDTYVVQDLLRILPQWLWVTVLSLTAIVHLYLILWSTNRRLTTGFAGWDAVLWMFITAVLATHERWIGAPQMALTIASGWVFIRSGFTVYGNRSSDYGDADRRNNN